jgi:choline dehydrogenase-like flavoprotein
MPLNFVDARILTRYLSSGIIILGVYHPDAQSKSKYVQLVPDAKSPTGDRLKVEHSLSPEEEKEFSGREKKFMKAARKLGAFPLKRINPGSGSGIHYAGTIPFSSDEKPFTLSSSGRLHKTKRVYVADSSGFTYLPSQGLTFSIIANAHAVAKEALHESN